MAYTPFERMDQLFEQMRRDMEALRESAGGFAGVGAGAGTGSWDSNLSVSEHEGAYVVTADLPGFETEDIDVRLVEGVLHIDAERHEDDGTGARHRAASERVSLMKPIVEDGIEASYRNGVLEIRLPFEADADEIGTRIEIN